MRDVILDSTYYVNKIYCIRLKKRNWLIRAANLDKPNFNYLKTDGESYSYDSFHTIVCSGLHSGPFVVLDKLGSKPQGILSRDESEFTSILLLAQS